MNLRKTQTCHLMKIGIFIEIGYLINKIMQKIGENLHCYANFKSGKF